MRSSVSDVRQIRSRVKELRSFGFVVGGTLGTVAGVFWWRGKEGAVFLGAASVFLLLAAAVYPPVLKPFQKIWMTAALLMGWVMTRVVLGLLYYFVLTPTAVLTRFFGKDFLGVRRTGKDGTFWIERALAKSKASYERQY